MVPYSQQEVAGRFGTFDNGGHIGRDKGGAGVLGDDAFERFRDLEKRVQISEKSNRTLLEQIVHLQNEYKNSIGRNEESLQNERKSRMQIENSLRASNDLIAQLASKLKRNEERMQEEHSTIAALVSHTKTIERAMIGTQQDMLTRRDTNSTRWDTRHCAWT